MSASNTPTHGRQRQSDRNEKELLDAREKIKQQLKNVTVGYGWPNPRDIEEYLRRQKEMNTLRKPRVRREEPPYILDS